MRPVIVHLPDELVVRFKQRVAEEGRSMRSVVEETLRRYIYEGQNAKPDDLLLVTRKSVEKLLHSPLA